MFFNDFSAMIIFIRVSTVVRVSLRLVIVDCCMARDSSIAARSLCDFSSLVVRILLFLMAMALVDTSWL